ncbi:MAG: flagellar biosynthesis anti-sigma factor FlgM [Chloroflexota bacterium]
MKIQDKSTRTAAELQIATAQYQRMDANKPAKASTPETKASSSTGPAATVSLSSAGREIQTALAKTTSAPDVRSDKVAEVRRRLEAGTYVIDPSRIAQGILSSKA